MMWLHLIAVHVTSINVVVDIPYVFFPSIEEKAKFYTRLEEVLSTALSEPVVAVSVGGRQRPQMYLATPAALPHEYEVLQVALDSRGRYEWDIALFGAFSQAPVVELSKKAWSVPGDKSWGQNHIMRWMFLNDPAARPMLRKLHLARDVRSTLAAFVSGEFVAVIAPVLTYGAPYQQLGQRRVFGTVVTPVFAVRSRKLRTKRKELAAASLPSASPSISRWTQRTAKSEWNSARTFTKRGVPPSARGYVLVDIPEPDLNWAALLPPPPAPPGLDASLLVAELPVAPLPTPAFAAR